MAYVCILLMMVYAIFGMHLLMGTTASCNDETVLTRTECVGTFIDERGKRRPRWWGNPDIGNFDSFGAAMLVRSGGREEDVAFK